MNLRRIAARIANLTAGPTHVMLRDMGYYQSDLGQMLQKAEDDLSDKGMDFFESADAVTKVLVDAVTKVFPEMPDLPKVVKDFADGGTPRLGWHEVVHKLLDPAFANERADDTGAHGHHAVESAMEEAFSAAMEGYKDSMAEGAYDPSAAYIVGNSETVGEALDYIGSAPVSTKERKRIRDAALHEARQLLRGHEDKLLEDNADLETRVTKGAHRRAPWLYQVTGAFLDGVVKRSDDWKPIMSEEMETKMRQLALRVKTGLQKLVRQA